MLQELDYFIDTYFCEDTKKIIIESLETLDDLQIEYENDFIELIMSEGTMEQVELLDKFRLSIDNMLSGTLKLHGIVLNEEATLEFKNKITQAIIVLETYEGKDDILGILESSEEPNYKFSELIEQVTELSAINVFTKIESVDPGLFKRLIEIFNTSLIVIREDDVEKQILRNNIVSKLKNIKAITKYDKALGFTLTNSDTVLGSDFKQYTTYADKHFEYLTIDEIAIEVFILLSMSMEGFDKPLITFRKYSQDLFSDLDKITKIDIKLNNLIIAYDKYIIENQEQLNA